MAAAMALVEAVDEDRWRRGTGGNAPCPAPCPCANTMPGGSVTPRGRVTPGGSVTPGGRVTPGGSAVMSGEMTPVGGSAPEAGSGAPGGSGSPGGAAEGSGIANPGECAPNVTCPGAAAASALRLRERDCECGRTREPRRGRLPGVPPLTAPAAAPAASPDADRRRDPLALADPAVLVRTGPAPAAVPRTPAPAPGPRLALEAEPVAEGKRGPASGNGRQYGCSADMPAGDRSGMALPAVGLRPAPVRPTTLLSTGSATGEVTTAGPAPST